MRISKQNFPILITILLHFLMHQNNYSQNSISQVADSSVINKPIVFKFNVISNCTGKINCVGLNPTPPNGTVSGVNLLGKDYWDNPLYAGSSNSLTPNLNRGERPNTKPENENSFLTIKNVK